MLWYNKKTYPSSENPHLLPIAMRMLLYTDYINHESIPYT